MYLCTYSSSTSHHSGITLSSDKKFWNQTRKKEKEKNKGKEEKMIDHFGDDVFLNATADRPVPQADLSDGNTLTDAVDRMEQGARGSKSTSTRAGEKTQTSETSAWDWDTDPENPYNWKTGKKWAQVVMCASFGLIA